MSNVENLTERIEMLEDRVSTLESVLHDGQHRGDVTSMRKFVERVSPTTHAQRALTIAYYLDQYQGQENFMSNDLEAGYRTCRIQKPANMSDILAGMDDKEWIMDDGHDGQTKLRRLTKEGLEKIEAMLPADE